MSGGSGQDPLLGPDLCSNPSPNQQPSRLHCSAQFLGSVIIDLHWELWCDALRKQLVCVFTNKSSSVVKWTLMKSINYSNNPSCIQSNSPVQGFDPPLEFLFFFFLSHVYDYWLCSFSPKSLWTEMCQCQWLLHSLEWEVCPLHLSDSTREWSANHSFL